MAVGKNKRVARGRKGGKRKIVDPFSRKEWYTVMAPGPFKKRAVARTAANRTQGTYNVVDALKGRVFEINMADLQEDEGQFYQKVKLKVEEVQGSECMTSFYGMSFTTDKLRSLVRKWHSLIEAHQDVKTADGFFLRVFCIAFTDRRRNQMRKTSYAQSSQIRQIRQKMFDVVSREITSCDSRDVCEKVVANVIGDKIRRECEGIYPLNNVYVRKIKVLKAPKFDMFRFNEGVAAVKAGKPKKARGEDKGLAADEPAPDAEKPVGM